jgi:hypothetical protein
MTRQSTVLVLALCAALGACQKDENPVRTSNPAGGTTTIPSVATKAVPGAQADRDRAPAPTPSTHAGAPQATAESDATTAGPRARDTPANRPTGDLTAAEESKAMPKPGQTDNHFTPSLDGDLKGTQQSSGTPKLAPNNGSPTVDTSTTPSK